MTTRTRIGGMLCLICIILILATFFKRPPSTAIISVTTSSGLSGLVELSTPGKFYTGDQAIVRSIITIIDDKDKSSAYSISGRLEIGMDEVNPRGEILVNVQPGIPVTLEWKLRTASSAAYRGNFWLYIDSSEGRELILAREIGLNSMKLLGLPVQSVRWIGAVGGLVGIILILISFLRGKSIQTA